MLGARLVLTRRYREALEVLKPAQTLYPRTLTLPQTSQSRSTFLVITTAHSSHAKDVQSTPLFIFAWQLPTTSLVGTLTQKPWWKNYTGPRKTPRQSSTLLSLLSGARRIAHSIHLRQRCVCALPIWSR